MYLFAPVIIYQVVGGSIDEIHRPVRLRRVVLSYPNASTEFKFDLSLNYRVSSVIQCYSEQKPTLVVRSKYHIHTPFTCIYSYISDSSSVPRGRAPSRLPAHW